MNDSRRRDFLKVAGGVAVVGGLAGCASEAQEDESGNQSENGQEEPGGGQEEEPPEDGEEQQEEDEGSEATGDDLIRIAHMIPDFPAVDVYVDDGEEPVVSGIEYTDVTGYIPLGAGDHQIRVTAAGAQSLTVFDEQVSVPSGNTTAVALGQPNGGNGGQEAGAGGMGFQLELFEDQNTPPEESINDARLRLIHASPDAPAINVLVGQTPVFENVAYGEAAYFDLPAGDYEFSIIPADAGMGDSGMGNESNGGVASLLGDGGTSISFLQEDEEGNETVPPEEGEEEGEPETEPVFTFDASFESNGVYTAFATGYLEPEAANSEEEFEVVITQDVVDGDVVEAGDE